MLGRVIVMVCLCLAGCGGADTTALDLNEERSSSDKGGDPLTLSCGGSGDYSCKSWSGDESFFLTLSEKEKGESTTLSCPAGHDMELLGECPHYTFTHKMEDTAVILTGEVEFIDNGEFILSMNTMAEDVYCFKEEDEEKEEKEEKEWKEKEKEDKGEEKVGEEDDSLALLVAGATFCPAADNTFNAGDDSCFTFVGDDFPFEVSWNRFYTNCRAFANKDVAKYNDIHLACDGLGYLNLKVVEEGEDLFLKLEPIYIVDQDTTVVFSYSRQ